MGRYFRRTTACERAARSISLRLDHELSELESAALDKHLAQCGRCFAIAAEMTGITQLLRVAPLVEPERRVAVASPRRARSRLVRRTAAGLALAFGVAAASVVAVFSGVGSTGSDSHASSALVFRNMAEQHRFVRAELQRLEPYTQLVVEDEPAPRLVGRGLV
jgi:predicted anti-sigma-YlaC factor YlaD